MKFVTFIENGQSKFGCLDGGDVIDLSAFDPSLPSDLGTFLRAGGDLVALGQKAKSATREHRRPIGSIEYDVVLPNPGTIFCLGLNYLLHVKEGPYQVPDYPTIFMRGKSSLLAHNKSIMRPNISNKLDFEAELAVIIGKTIKHATKETALTAVAGYSCFNDATLRDYQKRTTQWTVGKNFDQTGGFGPILVTPDELPLGASGLKIESRLNGEVMQSDNTSNMMFPVAETIITLTEAITLQPGDVLVMGTPSGVGYARNPPIFMKQGDICEIEIERIGILSNPVTDLY